MDTCLNTFNGYIDDVGIWERPISKLERLELLRSQRIPYELVSAVWLYKWFIDAEKEIPHMQDTRLDLVEMAADIHLAYQRKNYIEFKTLLLEFIREGRY
jgi:hypothetical protein